MLSKAIAFSLCAFLASGVKQTEFTYSLRGSTGEEIVRVNGNWKGELKLKTEPRDYVTSAGFEFPKNVLELEFTNDAHTAAGDRNVFFASDTKVDIVPVSGRVLNHWSQWRCGSKSEAKECGYVRAGRWYWQGAYKVTWTVNECAQNVEVYRHTAIESFSLRGKCTGEDRTITIKTGYSVDLVADWLNREQGCRGCIEQLYIGLKDSPLECLWSKNPWKTERGTYRKTYGPFWKAGVYEIHARAEYGWRCSNNYKNGARVATIRVVAPTPDPTPLPTPAPSPSPTPAPTPQGPCGPKRDGWVHFAGSCYRFPDADPQRFAKGVYKGMTWDAAAEYCESMDSFLPSMKSAAEQEFLREQLEGTRYTFWLGVKANAPRMHDGTRPTTNVPFAEDFHKPAFCYDAGKAHCGRFQGGYWTHINCSATSCGQYNYPVCVRPTIDALEALQCKWVNNRSCHLEAGGVDKLMSKTAANQGECYARCKAYNENGCCWFRESDKMCQFGKHQFQHDSWKGTGINSAICLKPECRVNVDLGRHFKVENYLVNGQCTDNIFVQPGQPVSFEADWFNPEAGCKGCIEQLYFGVKGAAMKCLWSKNPWRDERGTYRKTFTFDKPGLYEIHAATTWQMRCNSNIKSGVRLLTVIVAESTASSEAATANA